MIIKERCMIAVENERYGCGEVSKRTRQEVQHSHVHA